MVEMSRHALLTLAATCEKVGNIRRCEVLSLRREVLQQLRSCPDLCRAAPIASRCGDHGQQASGLGPDRGRSGSSSILTDAVEEVGDQIGGWRTVAADAHVVRSSTLRGSVELDFMGSSQSFSCSPLLRHRVVQRHSSGCSCLPNIPAVRRNKNNIQACAVSADGQHRSLTGVQMASSSAPQRLPANAPLLVSGGQARTSRRKSGFTPANVKVSGVKTNSKYPHQHQRRSPAVNGGGTTLKTGLTNCAHRR